MNSFILAIVFAIGLGTVSGASGPRKHIQFQYGPNYAMTVNGQAYGNPSMSLHEAINLMMGQEWLCKTYAECPASMTITRLGSK